MEISRINQVENCSKFLFNRLNNGKHCPFSSTILNEIHTIFSYQRKELVKELKFRQRCATEAHRIYPKDGFCLPKECVEQKDRGLIAVEMAYRFGIISYGNSRNLRAWIFGWE